MHRHLQALERIAEALDAVGQRDRRRRVGQQRRSRDQADDANAHKNSRLDALSRNFQNPEGDEHPAVDKEHVEQRRKNNDRHNRLEAL